MRKAQHMWPTDGATRKQLDRVNDRLTVRIDRLNEKVRELRTIVHDLQDLVVQVHGERRR